MTESVQNQNRIEGIPPEDLEKKGGFNLLTRMPPHSIPSKIIFPYALEVEEFKTTDFRSDWVKNMITEHEVVKILDGLKQMPLFYTYKLGLCPYLWIFVPLVTLALGCIIYEIILKDQGKNNKPNPIVLIVGFVLAFSISIGAAIYYLINLKRETKKRSKHFNEYFKSHNDRFRTVGKELFFRSGLQGAWVELLVGYDAATRLAGYGPKMKVNNIHFKFVDDDGREEEKIGLNHEENQGV